MNLTPHESELDRLRTIEPPRYLYHYTSATGLLGIAKTKQLWASAIQYLNDQKEVLHAVELAKLQAVLLGHEGDADDAAMCAQLGMLGPSIGEGVYVASFSMQRDDLSQWRAYCPSPGGFAVAVAGQHLREMAEHQGFYLAPCLYDEADQRRVITDLIYRHLRQHYIRLDEGADPAISQGDAKMAFRRDLAIHAPLLKHRTFEGEHEWRVVSASIPRGDPRLKYRVAPRGIAPYVAFNLHGATTAATRAGTDGVFGLVVGPTSEPENAWHAANLLLSSYLSPGFVGQTESPYRG